MITSTSNRKVKEVQVLNRKASYRRECGLYTVEGIRMFREAPEPLVEQVYVSEGFFAKCGDETRQRISGLPHEFVSDLGNKPMLVEFTADWCPNCKFLESTVYTEKNMAALKKRYGLTFDGRYFEVEIYPFWNDRALLEVELRAADEEVRFPPELSVLRDVTEDEAYLSDQAETAYRACFDFQGGGLHGLMQYAKPIRMRVYMLRLERMQKPVHIDPSYEMLTAIDSAVMQGSGTVNLSRDVYARVYRGILYMQTHVRLDAPVLMQIGENRIFPEKLCFVSCCTADSLSRNLHTALTKKTLDFDKIKGQPYFRMCAPQDYLILPGRGFRTLLKKQIQALVPAPERETLHILYDDLGCIWCERIGTAARVKPDADSRRILTAEIRAAEN